MYILYYLYYLNVNVTQNNFTVEGKMDDLVLIVPWLVQVYRKFRISVC